MICSHAYFFRRARQRRPETSLNRLERRQQFLALSVWLIATVFVAAIRAPAAAAGPCKQAGALEQICGLQSPEDMELLPGGKGILISEMAGDNARPGRFATLMLPERRVVEIEPRGLSRGDWGDPDCGQRPIAEISPHGIHLSRLSDGRLLLLAVNHGKTESVQAYDVDARSGRTQLTWRGCVNTRFNFNDVAATEDGFIGTHQYDKELGDKPQAEQILFSGTNTGFAVRWSKAGGFRKIVGTEAAFPNGITVSADGKTAWMAATAGRQVRKIDLVQERQIASADLPLAPDNLSWTADGQLLVTGAKDIRRLVKCAAAHPSCKVPFVVARIDPATLTSRIIFQNDGSGLLGASVAIVSAGKLYVGSFTGDHILVAPAPH